ncbi:MAG: hypothetical protein K2X49_27600 [Acetobacteraceae bacterium]|nr:hypothetical protein [Acetobacteraceae bacterium]
MSGDSAPWYGGDQAGSVTPLDSRGVMSVTQEKEAAAGQMVNPVTGALTAAGWKKVTELFGLQGPEFGFTPNLASGLLAKLPDLPTQQCYVVLFFTRPEWGTDAHGQPFFQGRVLHGFHEGPAGSGKTYFRGMDPDDRQPDFVEEHFEPGLKYVASWRHATPRTPWRGKGTPTPAAVLSSVASCPPDRGRA